RGIDEPGQRVRVGALELGEAAMLEDLAGQRLAERQLAQHVGVRRGPGLRASQDRQLELLEEDLRELLGRGDRELLAGQRVDLAREVVEVALELLGEGLEPGR